MELAGLGVVSLLLQGIHFHTKSGVRDRGFVLLRHVQHALLLSSTLSRKPGRDFETWVTVKELGAAIRLAKGEQVRRA
jgi:hypothetical protein